ncbi:MAG: serine protease, partial [Verrucomicrobiota bacterium]
MKSMSWIGLGLLSACLGCGLGQLEEKIASGTMVEPEDWIGKPTSEWPQIVLTNLGEFKEHTSMRGASAFLVKGRNDIVLAATAQHLIGKHGGVEPELSVDQFNHQLTSWIMYPRTLPDQKVRATRLGTSVQAVRHTDWLFMNIEEQEHYPAYPLERGAGPVRIGDKVFLVGCPYSEEDCRQNVYRGVVTERTDDGMIRYDIEPPVNISGFSGAPILNDRGHVVAV